MFDCSERQDIICDWIFTLLFTETTQGGTEGGAGGIIASPLFQNKCSKCSSTSQQNRADPEITTLMMDCQAVQSLNNVNRTISLLH